MSDKIYYDENCYVCSFEIDAIREKADQCGIELIDINSPNFREDISEYSVEMIGEFDGEETIGADTFRALYEKLGYKKLVSLSRKPVIRDIVDMSYFVFSHYIRPSLPKKNKK